MRAVIQRVSRASVDVDNKTIGSIERGFLVLLGVADEDTEEDMAYLVKKITQMRIFEDEAGKMNLSLKDVDGELLIISQFTLFASTKKGNRPSFTEAGAPDFSKDMYLKFIAACRDCGIHTEEGEFGAHMMVSLVNDGPVTITIDSKQRHCSQHHCYTYDEPSAFESLCISSRKTSLFEDAFNFNYFLINCLWPAIDDSQDPYVPDRLHLALHMQPP